MNRFLKFLIITVITGTILYLLLEIFKLRNKIKLLQLQLQNTETFNSSVNVDTVDNPLTSEPSQEIYKYHNNIDNNTTSDEQETEEHITREILEYEKELEQVDQLIDEINQNNSIHIEKETIDLKNIENEITKLDTIQENNVDSLETSDSNSIQSIDATEITKSIDATETTETTDVTAVTDIIESTDVDNTIEPTKEIISHYSAKYTKKNLQDICVENNLIKTGTKKNLIITLLQNNLLDNTLEKKEDTIEKYTTSESINENIDESNDENNVENTNEDEIEDEIKNEIKNEIESYQETSTNSFDIEQHLDKSNILHHLNLYNTQHSNQTENSLL